MGWQNHIITNQRLKNVYVTSFTPSLILLCPASIQVRLAAKALGLPNWQHAASPCLRSRLAFGVAATKENLERIDKAEAIVRRHLGLGPEVNLRVRAANPTRAAVAVDQSLLEAVATHFPRIEEEILALGFKNVSFRAYRTGMMSGFAEQQQNTT